MSSTYSTNLKLELIGTGDQSGTWGNTTNTNFGTLLEQAIVGYTTVPITDGADTTLTIANGAASPARCYVLQLTGALTANRNLIVPAIQKSYIIINSTTGGSGFSVTVKVSGQTGVTVANNTKALVYNNGTDIVEFINNPVSLTATQTLTNKTLTSPTINTATISGGTINSASVGATTPSTGAFTTLSASGTVSGVGFSNYLASPPAIGGTVAAAGTFTTLAANTITAVTQFSGPHNGTVGATTPNTGAFTTATASVQFSGPHNGTVGATTPSTGAFTTITASTSITIAGNAIGTNAYRAVTFSTAAPSGGVNGDIWYQV